MKISMLGTRGVPAQYGGFETCVEEVGQRLVANGHEVTVYCRSRGDDWVPDYLGMKLVYLPSAKKRSLETLSHTGAAVAHLAFHRTDVSFVFNSANAPWLPAIRALGIPVVTHVDGLEWQRSKWGGVGKRYYRGAESLAVRWSDAVIADAEGIADYYWRTFCARSELISYGAPIIHPGWDRLSQIGVEPRRFHLVVARFEPENNVREIVTGYAASCARQPLIVVGTAPYSDAYTAEVHAVGDVRVKFLGGVWDQELLDQLYANCSTYLHGHSVGGTNPSLLRAMGAGAAVVAFDVSFNREVLGDAGDFFALPSDVTRLVEAAEMAPLSGERRRVLARGRATMYDWDEVAGKYEALAQRLVDSGPALRRPSGRRRR